MATTVYYCACSLDGHLTDADDGLDWLLGYQGEFDDDAAEPEPMGKGGAYERFYERVGALVAGAVTYQWIVDHLDVSGEGWPYQGKPCWVLSSRELRTPEGDGGDVRIANAPVGELYDEMAIAAGDGLIWVLGGGGVASQFADEGLLDEVHVTVVPVVLGGGKPLFERRLPDALHLAGTRAFNNGMVELRYEIRR